MSALFVQDHELTWGTLVLDAPISPDLPYRIDTLAGGSSLGNPVPLVETVESLLTDGSLAVVTKYGNREITFRVRISAPDGHALAQAEAAFMAEVTAERPSPLVWVPPTGDSWPCVFDVVTARYDGDYSDGWDADEVLRAERFFLLTLECLPWARDAETTVIPAIPAPVAPGTPAVVTSIDTCDSATGWARSVAPTGSWSALSGPTASGGAVRASGTLAGGEDNGYLALTRTGAVAMSTDPYLLVDIQVTTDPFQPTEITVRLDGGDAIYPEAISPTSTAGVQRYYFTAPSSFTTMRVRAKYGTPIASSAKYLRVFNIARTDRIEIAGTAGFQVARTAEVGGTAPTQAAVRLDAGADPLIGSTALIYTGRSPAIPMRPVLVTSATPVTDTTKISGATNNLSTPSVFRIPVARLVEANYSLLARLEMVGSVSVSWSARVVSAAGADIPGSTVVESGTMLCVNSTTDGWFIHELGDIPMPVVALEGESDHCVEVTISMASGGSGVNLDEAWLLNTDDGAVTILHEPSAFQLTAIELRSPQLDAPRPQVMGTWTTYGTQDITRLVTRMGTHLFKPGLLHVFTATDIAKYAACELEYFQRYHTYPGPPMAEDSGGV